MVLDWTFVFLLGSVVSLGLVTPVTTKIMIVGPNFVEQGQPINLVCHSSIHGGFVDWFKDGDKLFTDPDEDILITTSVNSESKETVSELHISRSRMNDAGTYVCRSDILITSIKINVLLPIHRDKEQAIHRDKEQEMSSSAGCLSDTLKLHITACLLALGICQIW